MTNARQIEKNKTKKNGMEAYSVIVVGAGMVGIAAAMRMQEYGHQVTLIDRAGPAGGTSFGNAGILASSSVIPVTTPGIMRKAPKMLFDPLQPLFLRWRYLPKLMPWLIPYLRHANMADTQRIAEALNPIIGQSLQDHQALAAGTQAERWIRPCDYTYIFKDRSGFEADKAMWDLRKALGHEWIEYENEAFTAYDPFMADSHRFAVAMQNHGMILSPGDYIADLVKVFEERGGRMITADVDAISHENGHVTGIRTGGEALPADRVILAMGAWSGTLAKQLGISIPLEAERGYHIELWHPNAKPKTPLMVVAGKFVVSPMKDRIRLAGIVEFGGLKAAASEAPFRLLMHNVRQYMPDLTWAEETRWMGHRPAPTDSIPVIGEVPEIKGVFMGFGHHHVGLTGGAKTGQILAMLASDIHPNMDLSAYDMRRFLN
ncbi:MAG: NAD(P)/FAD-dependent oxidoreductase [Candidatus Puniceispirillales bacterium]